MSKRSHISLKTKLAAAVCALLDIPHEHAKAMHEEQVLSLVDWDHYPIPKAHDGPDAHYNLVALAKPMHREKTAQKDAPMIAKVKRVAADEARHNAIMAAKIGLESENLTMVRDALAPIANGSRIPMAKRAQRSQFACSRQSPFKKKMDGTVIPRR